MRYLIYIFLAASILLVGCGPSEEEKYQSELKDHVTELKAIMADAGIIELSEIMSDFRSNSVAASRKYEDQRLSIFGVLSTIAQDSDDGAVDIFVQAFEPNGFSLDSDLTIVCNVDESQNYLALETGTFIIVTGTFPAEPQTYRTDLYWLEECVFIDASDTISVEHWLEYLHNEYRNRVS